MKRKYIQIACLTALLLMVCNVAIYATATLSGDGTPYLITINEGDDPDLTDINLSSIDRSKQGVSYKFVTNGTATLTGAGIAKITYDGTFNYIPISQIDLSEATLSGSLTNFNGTDNYAHVASLIMPKDGSLPSEDLMAPGGGLNNQNGSLKYVVVTNSDGSQATLYIPAKTLWSNTPAYEEGTISDPFVTNASEITIRYASTIPETSYNNDLKTYLEGRGKTVTIYTAGSGSGGGEGQGGEGGDDPNISELQRKINNREQLTDAPTIYLEVEGLENNPTEAQLAAVLYKNRQTGEAPYSNAKIKVVDASESIEVFEDDEYHLEIKVRGNSTADPAKRPYRLKFAKKDKTTGKDFKRDLMGAGYKKRNWVLLANTFDHSMIRNALTYHICEEVGMPFAAGYKFVDLVINGNYRGTYQVTDHIEADKNRIDIDEDDGWCVEFQGRQDMLDEPMCIKADGTFGINLNVKNPEPDDETDETQVNAILDPIKEWFMGWQNGFDTNYGKKPFSSTSGWRAYNDEETLMKFLLVTEITGDYDGIMTMKAYRETDGKLCYGPVWDKDLAYGNYSVLSAADGGLVRDLENSSALKYPYRNVLSKDAVFMKKMKDAMDALISDGLIDRLCNEGGVIDQLAAKTQQTYELNFSKYDSNDYTTYNWKIDNNNGSENLSSYTTQSEYVEQLRSWLQARFTYVQRQVNTMYEEAVAAQSTESTGDYYPEYLWGNTGNLWDITGKFTTVNTHSRTLKANTWNPICMPFDISVNQMKAKFGNDYVLRTHTSMAADGETMIFGVAPEQRVYAGQPYLLYFTGNDVIDPTFDNVMVTEISNNNNNPDFTFNGYTVTYDNKHFFAASLFTAPLSDAYPKTYSTNDYADYSFTNDVFAKGDTPASITGNISGARAFLRIPNNEEVKIALEETLEYDVTKADAIEAYSEYNDETLNIILRNRKTIRKDEWNPLCLPFDANLTVLRNTFGGNKTAAQTFTGVTEKETSITFHFEDIDTETTIPAGTPFLVSPQKNTTDPEFKGVKFVSTNAGTVSCEGQTGSFKLIGTLQRTAVPVGILYFGEANALKKLNTSNNLNACRAYFTMPEAAAAKTATLMNEETDNSYIDTDIKEVSSQCSGTDDIYYTISGIRLNGKPQHKGVYIINGKKIVR